MAVKYGIELDQFEPQEEEEPAGFVYGDPPAYLKKCEERYFIDYRKRFLNRQAQNGNVFVRLVAGETSFGERCVVLDVQRIDG